jgi:hypothetical protein
MSLEQRNARVLLKLLSSVADRFDADPDPNPNFHSDADTLRIRIAIKTMPIHMWILPHVLHMLQNRIFFYTFCHKLSTSVPRCHNFQHLEQHIEIFDKKVLNIFICLEISTGQDWPDWHAWMPVPIR